MIRIISCRRVFFISLLLTAYLSGLCMAAVSENLLTNPSFEEGAGKNGLPIGWRRYSGRGEDLKLSIVKSADTGKNAVLIHDGSPNQETGLSQTVPGKGGLTYEASVKVRTVPDASGSGSDLQMRFLPSNKYVQATLDTTWGQTFNLANVRGTAPVGTNNVRIYLYTQRTSTPRVIVDTVSLVSGVEPPPPPPPKPVSPVYTKLKDLHLTTALVKAGKPNAVIVVPASGLYAKQAATIRQAVKKLTGATLPIAIDNSLEAAVPVAGNLIVLGNRSTNQTTGKLYNRYYTLLDLRYPGEGGYVVRTLHNPFGNGRNVVFVGGSDAAGVEAAAGVFVRELNKAKAGKGYLAIGRLAETKLGKNIVVPKDLRKFETWEASRSYGSKGYFGWNSLSKRMAMYYMTGDEFHAREFLRLAFPDVKARKEIAEIDTELIEDKDRPLSGPYHYGAHLMILFWDLIEESPVFTDEERLRVTNAFSKQLEFRIQIDYTGKRIWKLTSPPVSVGSRHGQWGAVSLYCLGRYFQKDYPCPVWQHCLQCSTMYFGSLHKNAWVSGESDHLSWYSTGIAPVFTYLLLSGDREPVENGILRQLLLGLEAIDSGRYSDLALRSASLGFLHKAAYLLQDGRYIQCRQRCGINTDVFRLGQSFWPDEHLTPVSPEDLAGKWNIFSLSEPAWRKRKNGFKLNESFYHGSYRSASDASGDFILLDGYNGAYRNPYHNFSVLQLRIDGLTILDGYRNQVLVRVDGLVEPQVAMNGALLYRDVLGPTAVAVGEVPNTSHCNWRRTLLQRTGRYALIVDDLTFRANGDNTEIQIKWETSGRVRRSNPAPGVLRLKGRAISGQSSKGSSTSKQTRFFDICLSDPAETQTHGRVANMRWLGPVKEGRHQIFFSVIAHNSNDAKTNPACVRVADNAAALALPSAALAVAGKYAGIEGETVVLARDHLFGKGLKRAGWDKSLIFATEPVNVDWDFLTGRMELTTEKPTVISMLAASGADIRIDGKRGALRRAKGGICALTIKPGRHVIENVRPLPKLLEKISVNLESLLAQTRKTHVKRATGLKRQTEIKAPLFQSGFTADVGGRVVDMITIPAVGGSGSIICATEGKNIHIISPDGKETNKFSADGTIRMLRWWPEHELLLAGCDDEQVIAFDRSGRRKWVFTSVMDPAVFRAAKQYWFKSAPGHKGIHGLYTGVFLNGKSQAFVGSACTLEILDKNGKLIKRMPQFWGDPSTFAIIDGPDGSLNLLAARKTNGRNRVGIINNKTLNPGPRGFDSVPPGYTYVSGWSSMNRHHLFYEDMNDDGVKEIISEINGTWNRMSIWNAQGKALYSASFGPG
ncbi:MAG: hypothetical protein KAT56_03125, partial [Sedimentisphaerales bacterium]|nr:hypothetical protein [Sedimentisphaerales bacterium]